MVGPRRRSDGNGNSGRDFCGRHLRQVGGEKNGQAGSHYAGKEVKNNCY